MLDKKTVALINEKLERIAFIDQEKARLQLEAQNLLGVAMGTSAAVEFTEAEIFPTRKSKVKKPKAAKKKKKEKGWSPTSTPVKEHPWRAGKKKKEDSESIEGIKNDIHDGMKAGDIADKHGVGISTVYNLKWTMKKNGELQGSKAAKPKKVTVSLAEEPAADPGPQPGSPALKRGPMTSEEFKVVKRMLHEEKKLGSEIVRATGVDMEEIEIAGNSNAYGMYIFNRKRPK